jgi:hypothetical protein
VGRGSQVGETWPLSRLALNVEQKGRRTDRRPSLVGLQMATKPKSRADEVTELAAGGDEKMTKIVDEVDRFFKSVHADIEDWKFSMEDYGDGTRIFVRFQIHINQSIVSPGAEKSTGAVPSPEGVKDPVAGPSVLSGLTPPDAREVPEDVPEPDGTGAARRADSDLASFVELWRSKREKSQSGEYHKAGAPYLDARSEWKGHKRRADEALPEKPAERTDEEPKIPDPNT